MRVNHFRATSGFSIVELGIAVSVLLVLAGIGYWQFGSWQGVRVRVQTEAALAEIAVGQRNYLLDHPTQSCSDISDAALAGYLSDGRIPPVPDGVLLRVNVYPPQADYQGETWQPKIY